ncbi:hypothetical protein ACU4GR_16540 [Methylobacterium oryzae CBMB20]
MREADVPVVEVEDPRRRAAPDQRVRQAQHDEVVDLQRPQDCRSPARLCVSIAMALRQGPCGWRAFAFAAAIAYIRRFPIVWIV